MIRMGRAEAFPFSAAQLTADFLQLVTPDARDEIIPFRTEALSPLTGRWTMLGECGERNLAFAHSPHVASRSTEGCNCKHGKDRIGALPLASTSANLTRCSH